MQTKIKFLVFVLLFANFQIFKFSNCLAQVPQRFNYQGIARDAKGNPMAKQQLALKLSVLPTFDAIAPEYEEVQHVLTNEFGLYTLQIGNGNAITGEMKTVKWETGNKYIKVMIDPKGGNDFVDAGTTQLLSVPYAIYADKAGMAKTAGGDRTGTVSSNATHIAGDTNFLTKFTGLNEIGKSRIFDNGTNIGIGTTTPLARVHLTSNVGTPLEHIRMENTNTLGAGRFTMYNNDVNAFATFTKYGTTATGGSPGISALYPFANLLAFGNNQTGASGNGRFLISTEGNTGISLLKDGAAKLKLHIDYATERVGIGGNAVPASQVHFNNTAGSQDTIKFTNNTMGHTTTDGLEIRTNGNNARLINRENAFLLLGTNNTDRIAITGAGNVGIGTITPSTALDVNGQVRIQGGAPGTGKVLTSDSTGLATWETPVASATFTAGPGISIISNTISNTGDVSNTNEIQTLSLVGSTLSLTSGGSVTLPSGSGGVSSVNGDVGAVTQSLSLGNTGTSPNIAGSGSNAVTLNLPDASTFNKGVLSSLDFTSFTNKLNGQLVSLNTIPKGLTSTSLINSQLTDNGTTVGINSASPNASAQLHINSTNKGILIPQVSIDSLKDITSIANPANGLMVYNTTQPGVLNDMTRGYYWYSTNALSWVKLADNLVDNKWQDGGLLGIQLKDKTDGIEMMDNYTGSQQNFQPKVKILKMMDSSTLNSKNNINALVLTGVNKKTTAGWEKRQKTSIIFENSYLLANGTTSGTQNSCAISAYTESTGTTASNHTNGLAFYTTTSPANTAVADTPTLSMFRHNLMIGGFAVDTNNVTAGRLQITGFSNGDQLSLRHPASVNLKWGIYVSSIDSSLNFYSNGSLRANIDRVTGVYAALSDRRYKKDIIPLSPVLAKVKNLKAYNYRYLDSEETDRKVNGFMAQDLLTDFPELVYQRYDRTKDKPLYTVDYSGFGVIAIKAIQEQQTQIELQNTKIELLEKQNELLIKRLEALENK